MKKTDKYILNGITEKTDNSVTVEFSVPKESPYFDGHFQQVSILPAVAQIEMISFFLNEHFNGKISITEIKKVKFTNFITPLVPLVMQLKKNGNELKFKTYSLDNQTVYASGSLSVKEG